MKLLIIKGYFKNKWYNRRNYTKGTEDSEEEFGKDVGIYQVVCKSAKGAFEIWIV